MIRGPLFQYFLPRSRETTLNITYVPHVIASTALRQGGSKCGVSKSAASDEVGRLTWDHHLLSTPHPKPPPGPYWIFPFWPYLVPCLPTPEKEGGRGKHE